ncbi:DUF4148 domain-containing protein [Paraburkholderia sp. DHOC27]|uniref:DUF4148 domain-containing protein n=1 Tax=Paraburkholderia sp. DHOC27 TaxID=2303330 RepID=UPI000E3B5790|nr:DUF4148 domain-containing protein [Paraburkholderia sp. DHOC27]RFU48847.1 DUF4148 domain-containing protein [Paraburkholderia sp. DHOC27]
MKKLRLVTAAFVALTAVAALPATASAQQTSAGLTRAQVRAELVQLEATGYNPHHVTVHYPADIQAAEAKVQATDRTAHDMASASSTDIRPSNTQTGS